MAAATAWSNIPAGERPRSPLGPLARTFKLAERILRVRTRDPWVAELLESTYAPLLCPAQHADQNIELSPHAGFANAFYAVRDCFTAFASQAQRCIPVYGACVALNGRAVLLLGPSTIGKSVLAFNMRTAGAKFLGDELLLFNLDDGTISAVPRTPSLREPGLPFLLDRRLRSRIANCRRTLHTSRGRLWYALDTSTIEFNADSRAYPLGAVYIATRRDLHANVRPIDFANGFAAFVRRMHRSTSLADLAALRAVTRDIPFYELAIGPPHETPAAVLGSLRACA
jgi:hypothetical protein